MSLPRRNDKGEIEPLVPPFAIGDVVIWHPPGTYQPVKTTVGEVLFIAGLWQLHISLVQHLVMAERCVLVPPRPPRHVLEWAKGLMPPDMTAVSSSGVRWWTHGGSLHFNGGDLAIHVDNPQQLAQEIEDLITQHKITS